MACGSCGQKNKNFKYRHTSSTGKTTWYDSEVQAKAAVIKYGGKYTKVAK